MDYVSAGLAAYQIVQQAQDADQNRNSALEEQAAYRGQQAAYRDQELAASELAIADQLALQEADAASQREADDAKTDALAERRAEDEARIAQDATRQRAAMRARMAASGVSPDSGSALVTLRSLLDDAGDKAASARAAHDEDLDALDRLKAARDRRLTYERLRAKTSAAQIASRRRANLLAPPPTPQRRQTPFDLAPTIGAAMRPGGVR